MRTRVVRWVRCSLLLQVYRGNAGGALLAEVVGVVIVAKTVSPGRRIGSVLPAILPLLMFAVPSAQGGAIVAAEQSPESIQRVLMQLWSD